MHTGSAGLCPATSVLPCESIPGKLGISGQNLKLNLMNNGKSTMAFKVTFTFLDLCSRPILRGTVLGHQRGMVRVKKETHRNLKDSVVPR